MKKFFIISINSLLSFLLLLGQAPLALAQEAMRALPMAGALPRVVGMPQRMESMDNRILNQDRTNRDDEIAIRQLIEQNNLLIQALCERQRTVLQLRREIYGVGAEAAMPTGCDSSSGLMQANRVMNSYGTEILSRDRARIAKQSTSSNLVTNNGNSQAIIDLVRDVERLKGVKIREVETGPIVVVPGMEAVNQANNHLEARLTVLDDKMKTLENKNMNLQEFKQQVSGVNDELRKANTAYDQMIAQMSDQNTRLTNDIKGLSLAKSQAEEKVSAHQTTISTLRKSLDAKTEELAAITRQWYGKDSLLIELKNKLTTSDAKLINYDSLLASKDKEIASLRAQLEALTIELTSTKDELYGVKTQLQIAVGDLGASQKQLGETNRQLIAVSEMLKKVKQDLDNTQLHLKDKTNVAALQKRGLDIAQLNYNELKLSISRMDQLLAIKDANFKVINESVIALKVLVERQKSELTANDQTITRLNNEIARLRGENSLINSSTRQGIATIEELRRQVDLLKNDFTSRDSNFVKVEALVKSLNILIQDLRKQLANKDAIIQAKEILIKNNEIALKTKDGLINSKIEELSKKEVLLKKQAEELNVKTVAITSKDAKIEALNNSLKQIQSVAADNQAQQQKIIALSNKFDVVIKQANERQLKLQELMVDNDSLKQRLAATGELAENQRGQIDFLKQKTSAANEQFASFSNQTTALEARLKELVELRNRSAIASSEEMKQISQELARAQAEVEALRQELNEKTNQSEQLKSMLDVYQQKNSELDAKFDGSLEEMMAAKKHQSQLEAQIAKLTDVIAIKDEQIKKTKEYFEELERRYNEKDQELKARDINLSMLQAMVDQNAKEQKTKIDELQQLLKAQAEELSALNMQLSINDTKLKAAVTPEQMSAVQAEFQVSKNTVQELVVQLKLKEDALAQVQSQTTASVSETASQLAEIARLKADLAKAESDLKLRVEDLLYKDKEILRLKMTSKEKEADLKRIADEAISGRQKEVAALVEKINAAEKKLQQMNQADKVAQLKVELKDSQEQISTLKAKLSSKIVEETASNNNELVSMREDFKNMQDKLKEVEPRIEAKDKQIQSLKADFASKAEAYGKSIDSLKAQVQMQKAQLVDLQQQLKNANSKAESVKIDAQLKLKQDAVSALEAELSTKARGLTESRNQINELRVQLKESSREVESLRTRLKSYEVIFGIGNEGYMIRDGKDLSRLMVKMNTKIESMQEELTKEREGHLNFESKYQAVENELKEARVLLQSCLGKVMLHQKPSNSNFLLPSGSSDLKTGN